MKKKQIKNIFFVVGNNGCGKNSIFDILQKKLPCSLKMMISYTTRKIRDDEIDNIDYYFTNNEFFEKLKPDLMECIDYGNKQYGYHKDEVINNIKDKNHLLFIIEPNGIYQILKWFKNSKDGILLSNEYVLRFNILHVKTKKSIRLKRMLSSSLSQHDDYETDYNKTEDIIKRLQREGDNIDNLLLSFMDIYNGINSVINYKLIFNNESLLVLKEKYLKDIIKDCNEIDYQNK